MNNIKKYFKIVLYNSFKNAFQYWNILKTARSVIYC